MQSKSEAQVSIIIINYNGLKFLPVCLDALEKIDYQDCQVILVDNASNDCSMDWLREYVKKNKLINFNLILNKHNLGFALANNQTALGVASEYLFFLNPDTKIEPNVIKILVEAMQSDSNIGICGCQIRSYDGEKKWHTGIGLDIFGYPVNNQKMFYVEGSALMVRAELFKQLGGFDEQYFMFHEDVDLAWRARLAGYQVVAVPPAVIYHFIGGVAGGSPNKKYKSTLMRRFMAERNNIRTLLKNYQIITLIFVMPLYFFINLLEIFIFVFSLKPKTALTYPRAWCWNIINLKNTLQHRAKIQQTRKISDFKIFKKMHLTSGKFLMFKKIGLPSFK